MRHVVHASAKTAADPARAGQSVPRRVGIVMAALLLSTSLYGLTAPSSAMAQSSVAERSFSIPAQRLSTALIQFSNASGIDIFFDQNLIGSRGTNGLSGRYTIEAGLIRLLQESGFTYTFNGANSVTITDRLSNANGSADENGAVVLDPIVVTGKRAGAGAFSPDAPYTTAGSSAHISAEQMERFPPSAPGDLFRSTPGVLATANRAGTKLDVNIRGLQGMNRVGITLDGAMQSLTTYRGYQGAGSRVYVDPDLIGGVDITKGPGDGSQSPGAIGGTVAMRTLNASDILLPGKEFGVRLRASTFDNTIDPISRGTARTNAPGLFDDFGNMTGSGAFAIDRDGFEVVIAGSRRREGNYFAGTNGDETYVNDNGTLVELAPAMGKGKEVFNTSQDTKSALAKLKWSDEEHAAELSYVYFDSEYGETPATALTYRLIVGGVATFPSYYEGYSNHKRVDTVTASYGWSPIDNDLIDLRVRAWGTSMQLHDNYDTEIKMYGGEIRNTSRFDMDYGLLSLSYGLAGTMEESIAQSYSFSPVPGLVFTSIGRNGDRSVATVFGNAEWRPVDWLTIGGGLSWDTFKTRDTTPKALAARAYSDLEGTALNPRVSVMVEPWHGIQFFTKYEQGTRPPSLYENTNNPDFFLVPNPDIKPETAHNKEVGINILKDGIFNASDSLRLKAAYFHNSYDDYLSRVQVAGGNMQVQNIKKAVFSGIEIGAAYDNRAFFAEGSLNYYDDIEFCYASGCKPAMQADYATNHIPPKLTASVTLGARLLEERLVLGTRASYFGKRALPVETGGTYFSVTSEWAPYTLVDAFASYEFNDNLKLDFAVDNAFDRFYVDALNNLAQPGPGRTMKLSLTGKF